MRDSAVLFSNKSFADIEIGDTAELERTITKELVEAFAALTGDRNPLHVDGDFARGAGFQSAVAHGMLVGSFVSTLIGMELPGPGALWTQQAFRWVSPVFVGDSVKVALRVVHKSTGTRTLVVEVEARNQQGAKVMEGEGTIVMTERRKRGADWKESDSVALVTGGIGGIGGVVIRALTAKGAAVGVVFEDDADGTEGFCHELADAGSQVLPLRVDAGDETGIRNAVSLAAAEFGKKVDVLVNNHNAAWAPKSFAELSWDDIDQTLKSQVHSAFCWCQAVIPGMVERGGGCIVGIGSAFTEDIPPVGWSAFLMAKAAVRALTRSLAAEFGPKGIRVNMVSPGFASSDADIRVSDRMKKVQAMQTPLRRLCEPEDVADVVAFLCSPGGRFLTGLEIPVSGGSRM